MAFRMYAVVYGHSHEDIAYFGDIDKAKQKLIIQSKKASVFVPILKVYTMNDQGIYIQSKEAFYVDADGYIALVS